MSRGEPVSDHRGSPHRLAVVDTSAKVRDRNFKYLAEGKGATVTARFGRDGITFCD